MFFFFPISFLNCFSPFFYSQHNIIWLSLQWFNMLNSLAVQPGSQQFQDKEIIPISVKAIFIVEGI